MTEDHQSLLQAATRKRERDKQSQRRKRLREREYISSLEQKIRHLENRLNPGHPPPPPSPSQCQCQSPSESSSISPASPDIFGFPSPPSTEVSHSPTQPYSTFILSSTLLDGLLDRPVWLRLPLYSTSQKGHHYLIRGETFAPVIAQLRATRDLAVLCPDIPKPIDLLFGGSSNTLANFIVSELSDLPLLPPEKFASSWLIYLYCRWLIRPSQATFERLPANFRPTTTQLVQEHPISYDGIFWPQLRDNLIRHGDKYDMESVLGLLSCTCRVRGGFNQEIIVRKNDGDLQVHPGFHRRFHTTDEWGLLEKFWIEYPELVEGMDPGIMLREESLISLVDA
ncbi:hypothetical protein FE257_011739 [Aspergillus nanangensis]|uniref:BZIP domain-containing protein n=1 Tax=Aspergillus nanangensis TaxID=2582783 RepID=A0AAD4GX03_ASPNN|nr:hypothetical protein FE257_011739 [Aspergillus nanangensis]